MTGKLLNSFLDVLNVPHTPEYTLTAFNSMPFKSLFGLSRLLGTYGVESEAYDLSDSSADISAFCAPFLARLSCDFVIVTAVSPHSVEFITEDGPAALTRSEFNRRFKGIVMAAYPAENAMEPEYPRHRMVELADSSKKWVLSACALFLLIVGIISTGMYRHGWICAVTATYAIGLYACVLLFLKSHGINLSQADNICGVIERSGCHSVLTTSGAKFFGIFGWAEVGLAYFAVSLGIVLAAPGAWPLLALINAFVCPFSIWSIWYQKYRAKAWCTLCLIVQSCMWIGLGFWLLSGTFRQLEINWLHLFALGAGYLAVMLTANALGKLIDKIQNQKS